MEEGFSPKKVFGHLPGQYQGSGQRTMNHDIPDQFVLSRTWTDIMRNRLFRVGRSIELGGLNRTRTVFI